MLPAEAVPAPAGAARVLRLQVVLAAMVVVPLIAGGSLQSWLALARGAKLFGATSGDPSQSLSGVQIGARDATSIAARAEFLKGVPGDALVFTGNSYLLPKLSGRVELFPERDLAYFSTTRSRLDAVVARVKAASPPLLLFDDPAITASHPETSPYLGALRAALADAYRLEESASGWQLWRKRATQ
jgi:hypothetical protein